MQLNYDSVEENVHGRQWFSECLTVPFEHLKYNICCDSCFPTEEIKLLLLIKKINFLYISRSNNYNFYDWGINRLASKLFLI